MALTPYTTPESVRAVCGISEDEIEDGTLNLEVYELMLERDLREVRSTLPEDYALWQSSPTEAQARVLKAVRLFAAHSVARNLSAALPLLAPKDIGDGKATTSRFADAPYLEVIRRVEAEFARARANLEEALEGVSVSGNTTAARTLFAVSTPSYDPVTGG